MCENPHYESVYFKELHNQQKYYWPTIYRTGAAVASTITSLSLAIVPREKNWFLVGFQNWPECVDFKLLLALQSISSKTNFSKEEGTSITHGSSTHV